MHCSFNAGFRRLRLGIAALFVLGAAITSLPMIAGAADKSDPQNADRASASADSNATFADGWRKEVPLAEPSAEGKAPRCIAWIEEGWLIAERRDTAGDVEWQIVLAQVDEGDEPPTIEQNPNVPGGLRLDYRGGRFFVHDDRRRLRCLRQRKSAALKWPALTIPPNDAPPGGGTMGPEDRLYYYRINNGWQFIARGLKGELAEYVLRMYCLDIGAFQMSARADRSGVIELTVGATVRLVDSSTLQDDGELLVVRRMDEESLAIYRKLRDKLEANRQALLGAAPPELSAAQWLSDRQVALNKLKGCAALVYFAGAYSAQVAEQLSALNATHGKYYGRGLEVVVVVPAADGELYAAIAEKRLWRFLMAVDDRKSSVADRFHVTDWPSYFLIGRDGKIAAAKYREPVPTVNVPPLPLLPGIEELETLVKGGKR